jgi:beta-phosphoglucomutase
VSRREIYAWEGESGAVSAATLLRRARRRAPRPDEVRALLADKERLFKRMAHPVRIDARLGALLRWLRARRVPLALVTGTSAHEVRRIVPAPVRRLFRVIITGDTVRRGKPHPEPYRTAIRRLKIRPGGAAVVENAPYGIRSARRAGAGLVIALASSLPPRYLREAHVVVRTVPQLAAAIRRLVDNEPRRPIQ